MQIVEAYLPHTTSASVWKRRTLWSRSGKNIKARHARTPCGNHNPGYPAARLFHFVTPIKVYPSSLPLSSLFPRLPLALSHFLPSAPGINVSLASNVLLGSPTCESRSEGCIGLPKGGAGRGWRGRFYSALRPELDLRLSASMGDAELVGQSRLESLPATERPHFYCSYIQSSFEHLFARSSIRPFDRTHLFRP